MNGHRQLLNKQAGNAHCRGMVFGEVMRAKGRVGVRRQRQ